jgi:type IV secretion system protein VirB10
MRPSGSAADQVLGERGSTLVDRAASLQSRLSSILAITLMSVLGLGALTWYYANNIARQARAKERQQSASASHAQGDSSLPSLGRIDPRPPWSRSAELPPPELMGDHLPVPAGALPSSTLPEIPLTNMQVNTTAAVQPPPTPEQIAQQRQLSGSVFANNAPGAGSAASPGPGLNGAADMAAAIGPTPQAAPSGELSALLRPSVMAAVRAEVLPAQRLLLPKGAFIDCTLETAIDSTLPGMTTCVMATDAFGVDGSVVLLERGTKLIGETRGQVQQGSSRVFVLWTEARTPAGVVVPLSSPGADELGRAGLPGEVNRHFWERFGAAMLISVIDGAVEAQSSRSGSGGTVVIDPAASQGVLTEVLKGSVNISPTVIKRNGDRIQVLVARDLDFRSVYELRAVAR